ncbi:MAG: pilus assembly protein N-terminal domain-containing protein [Lentisphaeria bacterium]|nr:pilus assembly protein N-terminal domain-containing protein [Lentisphaeria bacterium]
MRKLSMFLAVIGMVSTLFAADEKVLRIVKGEIVTDDVPFKITSINVSKPSVVEVKVQSSDGRQFSISGKENGFTDILLRGGGMSQVYKVTVEDDLRAKYNALKNDLEEMAGLTVNPPRNGKISIEGEISKIREYELKNKIVKAYGNVVVDYSTFRPTADVLNGLQKNLEKVGFKIVRKGQESKPGEISIAPTENMLTITGTVYSDADVKLINSVLAAQPWLSVNKNNDNNGFKVPAYVNIQVVPIMLQLDVVQVAISEKDLQKLGVDVAGFENLLKGGMDIAGALNFVRTRHTPTQYGGGSSGGVGIEGGLAATLGFLGQNGITRARRSGFITFKSNESSKTHKLHDGRKVWISSGVKNNGSGTVVTTGSNLTEVETGLVIKFKGGLLGKDTVSLDIDQSISYPTAPEYGEDYQIAQTAYQTSIQCKLGETIALGGLNNFIQTSGATGSIPYLRNIPVFKWLISQDNDTFINDKVITLICVRPMVKSGAIDPVALELEKMKQAEDKKDRDYKNNRDKYKGKWYEFWRW